MPTLEASYGKLFKYTMKAINPLKNVIITTECIIHKVINNQALVILNNDNYYNAYALLENFTEQLNLGVVWADQDFKSTGHFYNPLKERGLYGNTNALTLAKNYYKFALAFWQIGELGKSAFFLGATAHLVQDMTVPQHANIRLFQEHHKYEKFIRDTFDDTPQYLVNNKGCYMKDVEELVRFNALSAIKVNKRLQHIKDDEQRYYAISKIILPLAQRSTAGLFLIFYNDIISQSQSLSSDIHQKECT